MFTGNYGVDRKIINNKFLGLMAAFEIGDVNDIQKKYSLLRDACRSNYGKNLCPYSYNDILDEFTYYLGKAIDSMNLLSVQYVMSQYKIPLSEFLTSYWGMNIQEKINQSTPEIQQYLKQN